MRFFWHSLRDVDFFCVYCWIREVLFPPSLVFIKFCWAPYGIFVGCLLSVGFVG